VNDCEWNDEKSRLLSSCPGWLVTSKNVTSGGHSACLGVYTDFLRSFCTSSPKMRSVPWSEKHQSRGLNSNPEWLFFARVEKHGQEEMKNCSSRLR
jgi:hypothetical protein